MPNIYMNLSIRYFLFWLLKVLHVFAIPTYKPRNGISVTECLYDTFFETRISFSSVIDATGANDLFFNGDRRQNGQGYRGMDL